MDTPTRVFPMLFQYLSGTPTEQSLESLPDTHCATQGRMSHKQGKKLCYALPKKERKGVNLLKGKAVLSGVLCLGYADVNVSGD